MTRKRYANYGQGEYLIPDTLDRQDVFVSLKDYEPIDIGWTPVDEVLDGIRATAGKHPTGTLEIEFHPQGYDDDYRLSYSLRLRRPETDEEYSLRQEGLREAKQRAEQEAIQRKADEEARARATYEKLKQRFEART